MFVWLVDWSGGWLVASSYYMSVDTNGSTLTVRGLICWLVDWLVGWLVG